MTTVYRIDISPVVTAWGFFSQEQTGTLHTFSDGRQLVLAGDGNGATSTDGWFPTKREAQAAAASRVRALVEPILQQLERLEKGEPL
jgi:hypothetical protein